METESTPHQMLTAARCVGTAITICMVADRRQWPLTRVSVALRHRCMDAHLTDDSNAAALGRKIDPFERRIALAGKLDAAQRQSLLEIANKCPVHRTLQSEVCIQTFLSDPSHGLGLPAQLLNAGCSRWQEVSIFVTRQKVGFGIELPNYSQIVEFIGDI